MHQVLEVNVYWQMFYKCLLVSTLSLEFFQEDGIMLDTRHRTPALGEGEPQEHTWAPCEHIHHSFSSRALLDACSISETAGAISLQLGRNSVALSHCRRAQGPRSSQRLFSTCPTLFLPLHLTSKLPLPLPNYQFAAWPLLPFQSRTLLRYTQLSPRHTLLGIRLHWPALTKPFTRLPFTSKRTRCSLHLLVLCLECPSAHPLPKLESSGKKTGSMSFL